MADATGRVTAVQADLGFTIARHQMGEDRQGRKMLLLVARFQNDPTRDVRMIFDVNEHNGIHRVMELVHTIAMQTKNLSQGEAKDFWKKHEVEPLFVGTGENSKGEEMVYAFKVNVHANGLSHIFGNPYIINANAKEALRKIAEMLGKEGVEDPAQSHGEGPQLSLRAT